MRLVPPRGGEVEESLELAGPPLRLRGRWGAAQHANRCSSGCCTVGPSEAALHQRAGLGAAVVSAVEMRAPASERRGSATCKKPEPSTTQLNCNSQQARGGTTGATKSRRWRMRWRGGRRHRWRLSSRVWDREPRAGSFSSLFWPCPASRTLLFAWTTTLMPSALSPSLASSNAHQPTGRSEIDDERQPTSLCTPPEIMI